MDRYLSGSVSKRIGTQVDRYSNGSVSKRIGTQADQYPGGSVPKWIGIQADRYSNGSVSKRIGTQADQYPSGSVPKWIGIQGLECSSLSHDTSGQNGHPICIYIIGPAKVGDTLLKSSDSKNITWFNSVVLLLYTVVNY